MFLEQSALDVVYEDGLEDQAPQLFAFRQSSAAEQQSWLYSRATQQYLVADVSGGIGTNSLFYGQSPAIVTGNIVVLDLLTSLGYPITPRADGTLSIASGGDVSSQTLSWNVYRNSAFDGAVLAYVNYPAPIATSSPVVIAIERNQSITPVDMSGYITDPLGNGITFTGITSFPGSVSISSIGTLSGATPDANSNQAETIRGANIAGATVDLTFTLLTGNVLAPDVGLQTQAAATGLLAANYLNTALGTAQNSATVPVGAVISQVPAANNEVAPFSTVTIVLSLGSVGAVSALTPIVNATYALGSAPTVDVSTYFSGGLTFSMLPLLPLHGETLVGSIFTPVTSAPGKFGPFLFTAATGTASATLNEFSYTVADATVVANPVRTIRFTPAARTIRFSVIN